MTHDDLLMGAATALDRLVANAPGPTRDTNALIKLMATDFLELTSCKNLSV